MSDKNVLEALQTHLRAGSSTSDFRCKAISLEEFKAKSLRSAYRDVGNVRIWSCEHQAWWGPDNSGYYSDPASAGVYSFDAAFSASNHCSPEKGIFFVFTEQIPRVRPPAVAGSVPFNLKPAAARSLYGRCEPIPDPLPPDLCVVTVRMPTALRDALKDVAHQSRVSMNTVCLHFLGQSWDLLPAGSTPPVPAAAGVVE